MPRPRNTIPTYRRHGNEARCWVSGRWVSLGPWNSEQSRAAFARVLAEVPTQAPTSGSGSVSELILAFWRHAELHYRRADGTQTSEVDEYRQALRIVRRLYGHTPAREFGPIALQRVRSVMVSELNWCRTRVNAQVGRIRRAWKWAASQELVPAETWSALGTVAGLRAGRSAAREMPPVGPVPDADIEATLPHLVPTLRAMVQIQRRAGLRCCEVRTICRADLDTSGELWVYKPTRHKMSHTGRTKAIPLPPSARAILEPWLEGIPETKCPFTPARAIQEMYARRREQRKSKVQPSQVDRSKGKRRLPEIFGHSAYAQWVRRAARRAGVPDWSPGQIRHTFATEVRERFGLEASQILLGHAKADVTQIYAEKNLKAGVEAAKLLG